MTISLVEGVGRVPDGVRSGALDELLDVGLRRRKVSTLANSGGRHHGLRTLPVIVEPGTLAVHPGDMVNVFELLGFMVGAVIPEAGPDDWHRWVGRAWAGDLEPRHSIITRHADDLPGPRRRVHAVLDSNPECPFSSTGPDGVGYFAVMEPGRLYEVDPACQHRTANRGVTHRTHLIADLVSEVVAPT